MSTNEFEEPVGRLIPKKLVAEDLGYCGRSLARRVESDPDFPRPIIMGNRWFFSQTAIEKYKRELVRRSLRGEIPDSTPWLRAPV
jgi:hypothetical protein